MAALYHRNFIPSHQSIKVAVQAQYGMRILRFLHGKGPIARRRIEILVQQGQVAKGLQNSITLLCRWSYVRKLVTV